MTDNSHFVESVNNDTNKLQPPHSISCYQLKQHSIIDNNILPEQVVLSALKMYPALH